MLASTELDEPSEEPTGVARARPRCSDHDGTLTRLFFSDEPLDIARAKAICRPCALRASCLAGALERREPAGVWGGELLAEGRLVRIKRPRGRPPKLPRSEPVSAEVPLPPWLADELGVRSA